MMVATRLGPPINWSASILVAKTKKIDALMTCGRRFMVRMGVVPRLGVPLLASVAYEITSLLNHFALGSLSVFDLLGEKFDLLLPALHVVL